MLGTLRFAQPTSPSCSFVGWVERSETHQYEKYWVSLPPRPTHVLNRKPGIAGLSCFKAISYAISNII
jgi:hypothetical protein